jgi:hypothetical protein
MPEGCVRIERIENGYTVCMDDPKIRKANKGTGPWKDPSKEYSFDTIEKVLAFLGKNLDKALPKSEYSDTFDMAVAEDSEDD